MEEWGLVLSAYLIAQYASDAAPSRVQGGCCPSGGWCGDGAKEESAETLLMVLLSTTALASPVVSVRSHLLNQPVMRGAMDHHRGLDLYGHN